jgi:6-phosphogluconolactonase
MNNSNNLNNSFFSFESKQELHDALTQKIISILNDAIEKKSHAAMAVSGGSTPKPLFEMLSKQALDWAKVSITLVDERWVDNTHPDSNEKLVKEHLLNNYAKIARFIPLKNSADNPFEGVKMCNENLQCLDNSLDVVILGMGTDGHTASFFPKDENLHHALTTHELCAATIPSDAPHQRMTLSLHTLLQAGHLFLHIEGEAKKAVYDQAVQIGALEAMPIRSLLSNQKNLEVYYAQ